MPDNPYEAPKEVNGRARRSWPSAQDVFIYGALVVFTVLFIGAVVLQWAAIQVAD